MELGANFCHRAGGFFSNKSWPQSLPFPQKTRYRYAQLGKMSVVFKAISVNQLIN